MIQEVEAKKVLRAKDGKFLKGTLGPSPGRPPLGQTSLDNLLHAIMRVENKTNKKLLDHYITRAFKNDQVLISVMRKLIPDLAAIQQLNYDMQMNDELAAAIQAKLAERYSSQE